MKTLKQLLSLILFIFLLITTQNIFSQIVSENLQSYYDFNNNTEDKSGNELHGDGHDLSPANGIENEIQTAYMFNGVSSFIDCGNESRNITNQLTISAWVKTFSADRQLLVSKYNFEEDLGYFLATEDGFAIVGGRDNSDNFWQAISTSTIHDGEWHHIVGIIDQNKWQIWVDCFMETEITTQTANPHLNCTDPLTIGFWHQGDGAGNHRYFEGIIDEVRLYNRPVTESEVDTLCNTDLLLDLTFVNSNSKILLIYPNPSQNYLIIESQNTDILNPQKYLIFNPLGQITQKGIVSDNDQINISKLIPGHYTLQISVDSNSRKVNFTSSFVKL